MSVAASVPMYVWCLSSDKEQHCVYLSCALLCEITFGCLGFCEQRALRACDSLHLDIGNAHDLGLADIMNINEHGVNNVN